MARWTLKRVQGDGFGVALKPPPATAPVAVLPTTPKPVVVPALIVPATVQTPPAHKRVAPTQVLPGQEPITPPQPAAPANPPHPETHLTRTMAGDMSALKHGIDPLQVAHPEPAPPKTTGPVFVPASAAPLPKPATETAVRSNLTSYGMDPYRESVE